jgi:hypothetical protein
MQFSEHFRQALQDYIFLVERKYPEKTILEMVSTRYSLNHFERSILFRGVTSIELAERRKKRLVTIEQLNNRTLHIDLFNVLFTIAAYLRGYPVYIAYDGFLRDASESHGSGFWRIHLDKSLFLLENHLNSLDFSTAIFYIDHPLESRQEIVEKIEELARIFTKKIEIITDLSPDHLLKAAREGVIATSDSVIIDKSALPVFDLPKFILEKAFHPEFIIIS